MPVYVDDARLPFGRMLMCHMMADTTEELLAMATAIGVHHRWIQKAGTDREHFDVCLSKRAAAIKVGAIECDSAKIVELMRARRSAGRSTWSKVE